MACKDKPPSPSKKKPPLPTGYQARKGYTKIAVSIPDEFFVRVKRRACRTKNTFSETFVDLAKCGLLDIEESELYEPVQEPAQPEQPNQ